MRILGLDFFHGPVAEAVDRALDRAGLIVAPSGTCFARLQQDATYRRAMMEADLVLPDSGLMALLWRILRGKSITRISGLAYLNELLGRSKIRQDSILWVLPDATARDKSLAWLQSHGFRPMVEDCYIAPIYGSQVDDPALLDRVLVRRPRHIVIALSGGVQEKLGFYLRENYDGSTIHCIGAALGFITGYQIAIPNWADRLYLGWLLRLLSNPRKFLPRAASALALPWLILKYGDKLPALTA